MVSLSGGDAGKDFYSGCYFRMKQHFLAVIANFFSNGE